MSVVASEHVFLSALQPNTSVTTYGLPSEVQLGHGGSMSDEMSRARRVQQQVQMRLAEKSTLPRQNGSSSQYAMSDYGGSSTMKYHTYNPNYSSKSSYMYSGARTMGPRISQRSGFTSQSAGPDMAQLHKISVGGGMGVGVVGGGGGGGGGGYYREDIRMGNYQGVARQQSRMDQEALSMHAVRQAQAQAQAQVINPWMMDGSDAASMVSDRDATYQRQYAQSAVNGYTSQARQGGSTMTFTSPMQRSLSGTLSRGGGMTAGEADFNQQHSFKGPAHRTINRITNRNRMSMGSVSGQQIIPGGSVYGGGGDRLDGGFMVSGVSSASQGNLMQRKGTMSRAMSIKSMQSVGRGADIYGGQMEMGASMGNLSGITSLDMPTAVQNLRDPDQEMKVLGAAYIQHECYNDSEAKDEVRRLKGIGELVKLFNYDNQEVQRYATGATRNLIYENMDNKVALIEEGGIPQLVEALKESDEELHKNITGILWNLSSKDNLKEKLARETLPQLTEKILIPLSGTGESEGIHQSPSEADIFYNTTGCLRNMSSVNEKTRQQMRETNGLVDSLVGYIRASLDESKAEDKGVENAVCVLRNLSYQLYSEMPPSAVLRLEGPTRANDTGNGEAIGCFTPQSRKAKNSKNYDLSTFNEVARVPRGMEWLWHPQIVGLYKRVLSECEINHTTREAAAGALQNITAGDKRWASVLSRVALEQERILPVMLDLLRTSNDLELRSLTGFLRNLSRHAKDKNDMAVKVVQTLVTKLPTDGHQKEPSSEVTINICGVLNNLVTSSTLAARDITFFDGLQKLVGIKSSHDNSSGKMRAAKAASTVLSNMFQYKKLHKSYKQKGYTRPDFADMTI
ncbi:plakophilin-3-like [Anoplopoma fimbria]|uniref:plakophilin-3-like n=1 Tax=Anoplopoma fimbria TaxID=229290 RepID=UPI0023EBD0A8|nr:plakophilin-3-like [Anoplopoma fimbria]XP_054482719.1 plakophilin-3-like [Anoplopoma fimbria]